PNEAHRIVALRILWPTGDPLAQQTMGSLLNQAADDLAVPPQLLELLAEKPHARFERALLRLARQSLGTARQESPPSEGQAARRPGRRAGWSLCPRSGGSTGAPGRASRSGAARPRARRCSAQGLGAAHLGRAPSARQRRRAAKRLRSGGARSVAPHVQRSQ